MTWRINFQRAIASRDLKKAVEILSQQSTSHAGTPPGAVKEVAVHAMSDLVPEDEILQLAKTLSFMSSPVAKELACSVLALVRQTASGLDTLEILLRIADDSNWEVRECAAGTLASLLAKDFNRMYVAFQKLADSTSPNVRRALAVAVKYVAKERNDKWANRLFRLLQPLLNDRSPYVRRNLGPFALGDGMLRYYPQLTMQYINRWSRSTDEVVLWNVAMCLSSAEARKNLELILPILRELGKDDRPFVWRAVASAVRKHYNARPTEMSAVIEKWSRDPKLRNILHAVRTHTR